MVLVSANGHDQPVFFTAAFVNQLKIKKMAKQRGFLRLEGTIGDITFHKSKNGYLAKEKGGVSANRMATDPAFQRTRENGAEFGRAGKAGMVLRHSLRQLLHNTSDKRMVSRLAKRMVKVLKADTISARGERTVQAGDLQLLTGFEFNNNGKLGKALYVQYTATINRVAGTVEIDLPAFIPAVMVAAPVDATHFRLIAAGAEVDFDNDSSISQVSDSGVMPLDYTPTTPLSLSHNLTANSTEALFAILGIEFLQEVNGVHYPLKNGAYNASAIVKVSEV